MGNVSLNSEQKHLVVGMLLGDGSIEKRHTHPRLRIDHSLSQKEYVHWKYGILKNISTQLPRITKQINERCGKTNYHIYFSTQALPQLDFTSQNSIQARRKLLRTI